MTVDRAVLVIAGCMVLLSVALVHFVSDWFLLLTAFVGLNMIQAAFTGFCPGAILSKRLGLTVGPAFR